MQNTTIMNGWNRVTEKLRALVNPHKAHDAPQPPAPDSKEKVAPQLASWEGEGGKVAERLTP